MSATSQQVNSVFSSGKVFEISNDNPLEITNFDSKKDVLVLPGAFGDYKTETIGENVAISNKSGQVVATVKGVATLNLFTGSTPTGNTVLLSLNNGFFDKNIKPFFNESLYFLQNPDVKDLIASGQYKSGYDHYIQIGQYETRREDTFLTGTNGNDLIYGFGDETVLVGVDVVDGIYRGGLDVLPGSLGKGEVDTFIGSPGENIYTLGNGTLKNPVSQSFYVGQGDADYALIKGFDPKTDVIRVAGSAADYKVEIVGDNTQISFNGDLIATIESKADLVPNTSGAITGLSSFVGFERSSIQNLRPAFNEAFYLQQNADVESLIASGKFKDGFEHFIRVGQLESREVLFQGVPNTTSSPLNSSVSGYGQKSLLLGVDVTDAVDKGSFQIDVKPKTLGVGEADRLNGSPGQDIFVLGNGTLLNEKAQSFYIGGGDKDFATISRFDAEKDLVMLAGSYNDYKYDSVANTTTGVNDLKISTSSGDLVAVVTGVSNLTELALSKSAGTTFIGSVLNESLTEYINFGNDTFYGNYGDDIYNAGNGDNTIYADEGNNTIVSGSGNDIVYGGSGIDVVKAGDGNNTVYAAEGNNKVTVGSGNDLVYAGAGADVINVGDGNNSVFAGEGENTIFAGIGNNLVYVGAAADIINVGDGNNSIFAGEGNNLITTGAGNDLIYAGAGNDVIYSGAGDDLIYAGEGNNTIFAGTGNDTVFTGSGMDKFILSSGIGEITINGFGTNDQIILGSGLSANTLSITAIGGDTLISSGNDLLATLKWTQPNNVTPTLFSHMS